MKKHPRWISKTIEAADACATKMPWERGARRAALMARRLYSEDRQKKVSLAPVPAWLTEAVSA